MLDGALLVVAGKWQGASSDHASSPHAHLTSCTQLSDRSSARGTIFQPSQQYEGIFSCSRRSRPSHLMSPFSVRIACSTHPAPSVRGHRTHKVTPGSPRGTSQRLLPPAPTPSPQPEPLPPLRFPSPRPVEHAAVSPPRWRRPLRPSLCCSHACSAPHLNGPRGQRSLRSIFVGREDAHIVLGTHERAVFDSQQ